MKNSNRPILLVARLLWTLPLVACAASCTAPAPEARQAPPPLVQQAPARDIARQGDARGDARQPPASAPRASSGDGRGLETARSRTGARADRQGRFVVQRAETRDPRYIKTRDSGLLEEVVKDMNATIGPRLPVDVPIIFAELGQANAYYSPKERRIIVSYELLDQMIILFLKNADRDNPAVADRVAQQVIDTLSFVVYHEAAHAIIDLNELPITGREEDAADQLATVMIVTSAASPIASRPKSNGKTRTAAGGDAAVNGALYFLLSSGGEGKSVEDLPFWDEHSLSPQRFYNILTWVYGSDPEKHANLVQKGVLPESRARRAPSEYRRMLSAWAKILNDAGAV